MFYLHHSNRIENLFEHLQFVTGKPLSHPLEAEVVIVQNQGMARWLSQRFAQENGISANIRFPLPASFVWEIFKRQMQEVGEQSEFDKKVLLWRILSLLDQNFDKSNFEEISSYLADDSTGLKHYQLASVIADLFDQYLVYRSTMLSDWENNQSVQWQAILWKQLTATSETSHRAALLNTFLKMAQSDGLDKSKLPERISLFGMSAMAPGYLDVFATVASVIDVHIYLLNPSLAYWGDIEDERNMARLRQHWLKQGKEDLSQTYTIGNPLLASMGKQARDFLDQLHDKEIQDFDYYTEPEKQNLLSYVQKDILNLVNRGIETDKQKISLQDKSIQCHDCHSRLREVQVLYDQILNKFEQDKSLLPADFVVMSPDIEAYAPYIKSTFSLQPFKRRIPYAISDRSVKKSSPLIDLFLNLLLLSADRFKAPEVINRLEHPAVMRRFNLDNSDLTIINEWVSQSGIRWGYDASHRGELGLPETEQHTWQFGLQRLYTGYAMDPEAELYSGVAPYADIQGSQGTILGQLSDFVEQLNLWRIKLKSPQSPLQWQQTINLLVDDFFVPDQQEQETLQLIRDAVNDFVEQSTLAAFDRPLNASLLHYHLSTQLDASQSQQSFMSVGVTFCNMVPMRSVPFRHVFLLGMNDSDYPRQQIKPAFDEISKSPQKGDRTRREDDRYLFLEALLSARDSFNISFIGHSERDNSLRVLSTVASELFDYINQAYFSETDLLSDYLTIQHPLQAFSHRYFISDDVMFSYQSHWLLKQKRSGQFKTDTLPEIALPAEVTLGELRNFFNNPVKSFYKNRLGLHMESYLQSLQEDEPFDLNYLEQFQFRDELLQGLLKGKETDLIVSLKQSQGFLPAGFIGEFKSEQLIENAMPLIDSVLDMGKYQPPCPVELHLAGVNLTGELKQCIESGVCHYRAGNVRGQDLMNLWIEHLVLQCLLTDKKIVSYYIDKKKTFQINPVQNADKHLSEIIVFYLKSFNHMPFLPMQSAFSYAEEMHKNNNIELALNKARSSWSGSEFSTGDSNNEYYYLAARGIEDPLDDLFMENSLKLFGPMLDNMEKV